MARYFQSQNSLIYSIFRHLVGMLDFNKDKMQVFENALLSKNQEVIKEFSWIDPQSKDQTLKTIQESFQVIHDFLKNLYFHDKEKLKETHIQKGIRAIMILCSEIVQNLDEHGSFLFKGHQSLSQVKEYQELLEFYQKKLAKRLQKIQDQDEIWNEDWGQTSDEVDQEGLEDLSQVFSDREYELFFLKKENGTRFFSHDLLRHIKLIQDFYQVVVSTDPTDLLGSVFQHVKNKNYKEVSSAIKENLFPKMRHFFKEHPQYKFEQFYGYLCQCIYALCLASSPHNEEKNDSRKTSLDYYRDAWQFLEQALQSPDYLQFLQSHQKQEKNIVVDFSHQLCLNMFLTIEQKDLILGLICALLKKEKGGEDKYVKINSKHLWNSLREEQAFMTDVIEKHPSRHLYHMIEEIQMSEGYKTFTPLLQSNYPSLLYRVHNEKMRMNFLKMPMPVSQEYVHLAQETSLFSGFLDGLKEQSKTYLLFNLEDKTSWKHFARAKLIESLPKQEKYQKTFFVCTFSKSSDFYRQGAEYEKLNRAKDFKKVFFDQIQSEESCGFHYSHLASKKTLLSFSKKCIELIHKFFFGDKEILSKKNRQDFIEIFYYFFSLKIIDEIKPDYLSFTCKDALDLGPSMAAGFYAFVKLMGLDPQWSREEEDFLSYLVFAPSLVVRERCLDSFHCDRFLNALSIVDAELDLQRKKLRSCFEDLYGYSIFKNLCVEEIKN